jgi:tripartite-type tricarboxylate transporter receptor subunit TctC
MRFARRHLLAPAAALAWPATARAQPGFPRGPVRLLIPFAPGSGSDLIGRVIANGMKDLLGQPVVVENRPGAGGTTGTEQGARAAPDGLTVTFGTTSSLGVNAAQNPHAGYVVARDFVPVAGVARSSYIIATAATPLAPRSLRELVDRLRPGDGNYAMGGIGTLGHLCSELFLRQAGVRAEGISYRGSAPALTDLAAGREMFSCDTLAAMTPFIAGGRLRPLAVTAPQRLPALAEVPTTAEAGLPDLRVEAWFGMVVPSGTPPAIVATLSEAALRTARDPATIARLEALTVEPMPLPPDAFAALMRDSTTFWVDFVRAAGIRIEF